MGGKRRKRDVASGGRLGTTTSSLTSPYSYVERESHTCQQYLLPPKESGYEAMCVSVSFVSAPPQCNRSVPQNVFMYVHVVIRMNTHVYRILNAHTSKCFCITCVCTHCTYILNMVEVRAYSILCPHNMCMHDKQHMQDSRAGKSHFTFKKERTIEF